MYNDEKLLVPYNIAGSFTGIWDCNTGIPKTRIPGFPENYSGNITEIEKPGFSALVSPDQQIPKFQFTSTRKKKTKI